MKTINYKSIEVDGVDTKDYPDFSDAYFSYAEYADGTPFTDEELEKLTENGDLLHEHIYSTIY